MHLADISLPARGAYTTLPDLISLRFPAKQLQLTRKKRALSVLAGPNKSNFRGRGIDFEEVRSYQPGDDIRTIDWRVTARTGNAHTKLFREERERPVLVVIDQRNSKPGEIVRRRIVVLIRQPGCVDEVRACHPKLLRILVHDVSKRIFASGHMFS